MTRIYAIVAALAMAALLLGSYFYPEIRRLVSGRDDPFADCRAGAVGGGDIGGPFTLLNGDGQTVTDKDVLTKPSLIYFGYTFCPDVCPADNARNAEATDILEERGFDVQPVFISIDPERDTPEVVKEFAANLHPKMVGLTGSPDQVKAASLAYKTYYRKQEGDSDYYLMDHSTFTYLVMPGYGFVDFFKRDDTAAAMADRVACFADKAAR
ncbi:SCO family protein [Fuscibacter oryzae]|uniref:SCO family protein n=1 Tax=Fuscibacter oryzae TaxID=2803939 RepID=A0A8J7SVU6_9RHOB|nr:SCO family protein [Fuscibacter oryzae]MBL4929041.1 SCO family protein [Fuscibacter oryzae]